MEVAARPGDPRPSEDERRRKIEERHGRPVALAQDQGASQDSPGRAHLERQPDHDERLLQVNQQHKSPQRRRAQGRGECGAVRPAPQCSRKKGGDQRPQSDQQGGVHPSSPSLAAVEPTPTSR